MEKISRMNEAGHESEGDIKDAILEALRSHDNPSLIIREMLRTRKIDKKEFSEIMEELREEIVAKIRTSEFPLRIVSMIRDTSLVRNHDVVCAVNERMDDITEYITMDLYDQVPGTFFMDLEGLQLDLHPELMDFIARVLSDYMSYDIIEQLKGTSLISQDVMIEALANALGKNEEYGIIEELLTDTPILANPRFITIIAEQIRAGKYQILRHIHNTELFVKPEIIETINAEFPKIIRSLPELPCPEGIFSALAKTPLILRRELIDLAAQIIRTTEKPWRIINAIKRTWLVRQQRVLDAIDSRTQVISDAIRDPKRDYDQCTEEREDECSIIRAIAGTSLLEKQEIKDAIASAITNSGYPTRTIRTVEENGIAIRQPISDAIYSRVYEIAKTIMPGIHPEYLIKSASLSEHPEIVRRISEIIPFYDYPYKGLTFFVNSKLLRHPKIINSFKILSKKIADKIVIFKNSSVGVAIIERIKDLFILKEPAIVQAILIAIRESRSSDIIGTVRRTELIHEQEVIEAIIDRAKGIKKLIGRAKNVCDVVDDIKQTPLIQRREIIEAIESRIDDICRTIREDRSPSRSIGQISDTFLVGNDKIEKAIAARVDDIALEIKSGRSIKVMRALQGHSVIGDTRVKDAIATVIRFSSGHELLIDDRAAKYAVYRSTQLPQPDSIIQLVEKHPVLSRDSKIQDAITYRRELLR